MLNVCMSQIVVGKTNYGQKAFFIYFEIMLFMRDRFNTNLSDFLFAGNHFKAPLFVAFQVCGNISPLPFLGSPVSLDCPAWVTWNSSPQSNLEA